MYNGQQDKKQVKNTTAFLPPIQSNNVDIGQKRTVPWLQEDNRETKTPKIEEKHIQYSKKKKYSDKHVY